MVVVGAEGRPTRGEERVVDEAWAFELVPPSPSGRRYERGARVRLGDAGADGRLRPDGFVRLLQDVASDDWADTAVEDGSDNPSEVVAPLDSASSGKAFAGQGYVKTFKATF